MKKKALSVLLLCLAAAVIQAGCGGASYDSQKSSYESAGSSFYEEGVYEEPAAAEDVIAVENGFSNEATEEAVANDQEVAVQQRKLIRNVEMTVETEVYEELMQGIENKIDALGGYIEYKDVYHGDLYSRYQGNVRKNAELVVRIPSAKLDEFTVSVGEIGNVTYESESVEDVTLEYVDLESHKKMLQTQQERLLELLEKAETMEDIISLESRLTEVRYQIESMESRLRTIDNQVEYSTVRLSIEEVERYTPQPEESVIDRIKTGFSENVYNVATGVVNFVVEFIIALPILLLLVFVCFIISFIFKFFAKKRRKRENSLKDGSFLKSLADKRRNIKRKDKAVLKEDDMKEEVSTPKEEENGSK